MSNVAILRILVALNINFYSVKNSTLYSAKFTENSNFKGFGPSKDADFVFLDNSSKNNLRLFYEIK